MVLCLSVSPQRRSCLDSCAMALDFEVKQAMDINHQVTKIDIDDLQTPAFAYIYSFVVFETSFH